MFGHALDPRLLCQSDRLLLALLGLGELGLGCLARSLFRCLGLEPLAVEVEPGAPDNLRLLNEARAKGQLDADNAIPHRVRREHTVSVHGADLVDLALDVGLVDVREAERQFDARDAVGAGRLDKIAYAVRGYHLLGASQVLFGYVCRGKREAHLGDA